MRSTPAWATSSRSSHLVRQRPPDPEDAAAARDGHHDACALGAPGVAPRRCRAWRTREAGGCAPRRLHPDGGGDAPRFALRPALVSAQGSRPPRKRSGNSLGWQVVARGGSACVALRSPNRAGPPSDRAAGRRRPPRRPAPRRWPRRGARLDRAPRRLPGR